MIFAGVVSLALLASPSFVASQDVVPVANPNYVAILNNSLWFYEAQRSGKLDQNGYQSRISWRHDSGMDDGKDVGVDLTGGYYDAGDYLKFLLPLAYSLTITSWGALEYWQGYKLASQDTYLRDMLKWGTDWIMKAHPDANTLYVQVGKGNVDNNYWGPDTGIPTPRPAYKIDFDHPGTDIASETAASLAATSLVFRNYFGDADYADKLVKHARDLFNFANTARKTEYQKSVSDAKEFYASSGYGDELVWGALWLSRATNETSYLDIAVNYFDQYKLGGKTNPMDWNDKTPGIYVLASEVFADNNAQRFKNEAEAWLDGVVSGSKDGSFTKAGLIWFSGTSDMASTVPANTCSFLASIYSRTVLSKSNTDASQAKKAKYESFVQSQIDYLLGKNPQNTPYVAGVHVNSPQNPHHAGAHGGTDVGNLNNPPQNQHVLYGAMVGGPNKDDQFYDERTDWKQSEVALDYNAPFQALMARQVMFATSDPPYVSLPFTPRPVRPKKSKTGLIVGLTIFAIIVVVCAITAYFMRHRIFVWWQSRRYKSRIYS
ncbi:glycoside hydrolase family 9 protein [Basidiobolus meristosporus CBS 931.73]|uniref:Endoglucanase n=1 Tax=Basidiobolus meristosporus CBS 931.73 TaxID=1314790 RepID=A0A1Y1XUA5_9FUNG|nr:glycoside hydrolase family 9 protein [Basidiobolus meristosporus CBS 931.73]|eukprot:ORX89347.1 glycoside hydrolase family 9 protein [Basidiobolus meristosporus CBS 931.73]